MAENKILVSLHGNRVGLDKNGSLIIDDVQVTDGQVAPGAKNGNTVSAKIVKNGGFTTVKLTCTATPIVFADEAGQGQYGGVKVFDFEEGLIQFIGATVDGDITLTEAAWIDTWDGDFSLGTAVMADAQGLDGTAVDLLAAAATAQAVAQVASVQGASAAGNSFHDGTTTAKDMYLNVEIDDNAAHAAGNGTFTGTIEFTYIRIGDND
jgi:hypothetical protein